MHHSDFFERQLRAHRRTRLLITLYILLIIFLIAGTYLAIAAIGLHHEKVERGGITMHRFAVEQRWWRPMLLAQVSMAILALVSFGAFFKWWVLAASGGRGVAESLGGRHISPDTTDPAERLLINIVEEMSLASGVPVPATYVLDYEQSINAFAAGLGFDDAAIGMTRGALAYCTRDELQGIVAHEYSHILHGDMRLNMQTIAMLQGVLLIYIIGRFVYHIGLSSTETRSRRSQGSAGLVIAGLGAAIAFTGWIGVLGARLIKGAISRQRDFLADAAAAQFTRYPEGLARALLKIGLNRSTIRDAHAEELSHLFFSNALGRSWFHLFATHPPVLARVELLAPELLEGELEEYELKPVREVGRAPNSNSIMTSRANIHHEALGGSTSALAAVGSGLMGTIDQFQRVSSSEQTSNGHTIIPAELRELTHSSWGAALLVIALLVKKNTVIASEYHEQIQVLLGSESIQKLNSLLPLVHSLSRPAPLQLLELAAQSLWTLPEQKQRLLTQLVSELVESDERVDAFELTIEVYLSRALPELRPQTLLTSKVPFSEIASILLSLQVNISKTSRENLFERLQDLPRVRSALAQDRKLTLSDLRSALKSAASLSMAEKREIAEAMARCVFIDHAVSMDEYEMLRTLYFALGVPFPSDIMVQVKEHDQRDV